MTTLALTHWNRSELLEEAFAQVKDDPRLDEIVIVDDASSGGHYQQIVNAFWKHPRTNIFRNDENLDSYVNKARAVELSAGPWVFLFDSDNVMPVSYLDAAFACEPWESDMAYLPTFAEPEFDYRAFSGLTITRANVAEYMNEPLFATALNTGNYLIHRDEYLRVWNPDVIPYTSEPIIHNFYWLEAGNKLFFVPGMQYFHRIHDGSHFVQNDHKTGSFARKVETMLRLLR